MRNGPLHGTAPHIPSLNIDARFNDVFALTVPDSKGDRDLFVRSGQQLVGREAAQEADPLHRPLYRLASE